MASGAVDPQRRRLTVGQAGQATALGESGANDNLAAALSKDNDKLVIVHSCTDGAMKKKKAFGEKDRFSANKSTDVTRSTDPKEDDSTNTFFAGVNFTCKKGLKPESPNQDSFVVFSLPSQWTVYGVFDGHGPNGHDVSDFAVKNLCLNFYASLTAAGDGLAGFDAGAAFTKAFTECQVAIENAKAGPLKLDASSSGSTCTMAFHDLKKDVLTVAHAGDSRAVLFRGDNTVLNETEDHKPNLPNEKKRIEEKGGRVIFDGYYNYRIFAKAGMYPGLNMSRALGDVVAHKEAGLTAEPELTVINVADKRKDPAPLNLLICSDGVWEFIKSPDALGISVAAGEKELPSQKGVEKLAKKSWDSWMEDSDNEISDDITVIAVRL